MRKISIICIMLLLSMTNRSNAVNSNVDNDNAIEFIKEFYERFKEMNTPSLFFKYSTDDEVYNAVDSLAQFYCTDKIRKQSKPNFEYGLYFYVDEEAGLDTTTFKTLSIVEDKEIPNTYIVTYTQEIEDIDSKIVTWPVKLVVTVIKEDGRYWIDEVKQIK